MITTRHVHFNNAPRALQCWLLWAVLCLNVSVVLAWTAVGIPMLWGV